MIMIIIIIWYQLRNIDEFKALNTIRIRNTHMRVRTQGSQLVAETAVIWASLSASSVEPLTHYLDQDLSCLLLNVASDEASAGIYVCSLAASRAVERVVCSRCHKQARPALLVWWGWHFLALEHRFAISSVNYVSHPRDTSCRSRCPLASALMARLMIGDPRANV